MAVASEKSVKKTGKRISELDALRGMAALCVLLFHYTNHFYGMYFPVKMPPFLFPYGYFGVHLFFIISGFVIFMTLEKTKHPLDFVVSRFSRLFPAYWCCVLVTFCAVRFFHFPGREVSFKAALFNLTMLQNWFNVAPVDGVYWTLSVELSFYVLMLILFISKIIKKIEVFGFIWLMLIVFYFNFQKVSHYIVPAFLVQTGLLDFGNLFLAGIVFYKIRTQGHTWKRHALILSCLATQFVVEDAFLVNHPKVVVLVFLVFYLFIFNRLSFLSFAPALFLGEISYSFYLIHQNIGYLILYHGLQRSLPPWLLFFIALIVAFCLATLICLIFEKPAMKYIREVYKRGFRSEKKPILAKEGSYA
jgi:peptidoglycan/LPS O-acetylase OafA/YrhL